MSELLRLFGLRFLFFSNDRHPLHLHVVKGQSCMSAKAKFTLDPARLIENQWLSKNELKKPSKERADAIVNELRKIGAELSIASV